MKLSTEELAKAAMNVRDEADEAAGFYGLRVVVVVLDDDGAFSTCGSPDLNITAAVGALARATHAFATFKENKTVFPAPEKA